MASTKTSQSSYRMSWSDKSAPTPMDFDLFVPWVCVKWQKAFTVQVSRMEQEPFESLINSGRRSVKKHDIRLTPSSQTKTTTTQYLLSTLPNSNTCSDTHQDKKVVPLNAHYDTDNNLVEVAIVNSPTKIHKKLIQAFNLCMIFHPHLTKLRIRRSRINSEVIQELSRLLHHSNLTHICLDDSFVPEGNYDILLEKNTSLKYLFLNRCSINDKVCANICKQIDRGHHLAILELSSNFISDAGAISLANILRKNRNLRHLNLSGNQITDDGAVEILNVLMEFRMTIEEITKTKELYVVYLRNRNKIYQETLQNFELQALTPKHITMQSSGTSSLSVSTGPQYRKDLANRLLDADVEEFKHPYFDNSNVILKEGSTYCFGNFMLNSINFAYNNFGYRTLEKLNEVLRYQRIRSSPHQFGLIRINLEGNYMPQSNCLVDSIQFYLGQAVREASQSQRHKLPSHRYVGKSQGVSRKSSLKVLTRASTKVKSSKSKDKKD